MAYQLYLATRQFLRAHFFNLERLNMLLTRRWAANIGILILTFLITATNIYASNGDQDIDVSGNKSLIAKLTQEFEDDLLVEEADEWIEPAPEVSYLDGQALSVQDAEPSSSAEDEIAYSDEDEESVAMHLNAIWSQPEPMSEDVFVPTRTEIAEYVVVDGDTVESIARSFGLRSATVLQANNLGTRGVIRIGQTLRIPPVDGIIYKIKKGDTLDKIARTYKSDVAKIGEYNRLADGSLQVGTELVLPGGRLPAPPAAPAAPATGKYAAGVGSGSVDPNRLSKGTLLWPATSRRITQYYKRGHTGLDIGGPLGSPLYAVEGGKVIYSGWNRGGYGNMVVLDHGGGLYTRYAHATKLLVKLGDTVARGDTIALLGSTGRSTGPHLHFEVMTGSLTRRLNPLDYIK